MDCSMISHLKARQSVEGTKAEARDLLGDSERDEDHVMMAFQVIGAVFLTLFLAAAMSGESTQRR